MILVTGQLLLLAATVVAGPMGRTRFAPIPGRLLAALCFFYAAWAGLAGVRRLGRQLTPMPIPKAEGELITTGIYARLRHPLYASTMALGLGWALAWSSPTALGLAAMLAGWLHFKAQFEEVFLQARFRGYADYARRVPRYFPRPFHRPSSHRS